MTATSLKRIEAIVSLLSCPPCGGGVLVAQEDYNSAALARFGYAGRLGGRARLYLYRKRRGLSRLLLRVVSAARRVATRSLFPLLRAFCFIVSVALHVGIDRFSARLEKPYTAEEAAALRQAGLRDVRVFPMFGWIADGIR